MAISLNQLMQAEQNFNTRDEVLSIVHCIAQKQTMHMSQKHGHADYHYSAAHYNEKTTGIEHLCRLMWGVVPMGADGQRHHHFICRQIIAGTTPGSAHYWDLPVDYDQRVVEMAAIAVAIFEQPEYYWAVLSKEQQGNLVHWLSCVSSLNIPSNNWRWFRILILTALKKQGQCIDEQVLEQDLCFVDKLHLDHGWYQDGTNGVVDYYNPFAFQLYALTYCRWNFYRGERCEKLLKRAIEFANTYQLWFGDDGKQLAYGRSLNYRFAAAGFWSELARSNHPSVDRGLCRSIWTMTMRWWAAQPIWDNQGQLIPGFAYPNLLTTEFYTSSVSPMLALKAFNVLNLPEDHEFWTSPIGVLERESSPAWIADRHLVWRDGGSYMITNGPSSAELRHCSDKYNKFAYSSDHGLCVESSRWIEQGWIGDNIFAIQHPETGDWIAQGKNKASKRVGDALVCSWQPFTGCTVILTQQLIDGKEHRTFYIESDKKLAYVLSGYAVDKWSAWYSHEQSNMAKVSSERLFSELQLEQGNGKCAVYPCAPNTNLLYQHASVPVIRGDLMPGQNELSVVVIAGRLTSYANKATHTLTSNNSHQGVTDEY